VFAGRALFVIRFLTSRSVQRLNYDSTGWPLGQYGFLLSGVSNSLIGAFEKMKAAGNKVGRWPVAVEDSGPPARFLVCY
jgi:hypothetical protein